MFSNFFSGIFSFAILILSSYQGNDAGLSSISIYNFKNGYNIVSRLENSFVNDFETFFKSGKTISIWFDLKITNKNELIDKITFRHSVIYDPIENNYKLFLEEKNESISLNSIDDLIKNLSLVEVYYDTSNLSGIIELELESYLKPIYIESIEKKFNMMILWKFKKPYQFFSFNP